MDHEYSPVNAQNYLFHQQNQWKQQWMADFQCYSHNFTSTKKYFLQGATNIKFIIDIDVNIYILSTSSVNGTVLDLIPLLITSAGGEEIKWQITNKFGDSKFLFKNLFLMDFCDCWCH